MPLGRNMRKYSVFSPFGFRRLYAMTVGEYTVELANLVLDNGQTLPLLCRRGHTTMYVNKSMAEVLSTHVYNNR